jgi:hypothetical protein
LVGCGPNLPPTPRLDAAIFISSKRSPAPVVIANHPHIQCCLNDSQSDDVFTNP